MEFLEQPFHSGRDPGKFVPYELERERLLEEDTTSTISKNISASPIKSRENPANELPYCTQESLPKSKKKTVISKGKSISSKKNAPNIIKSSPMLHLGSTLKEKVLSPFWTSSKKEMSKKLWYHSKTDSLALDWISLNASSNNMKPRSSWFQTKQTSPTNKNLPKISSQFVTSSWPKTMANEPLTYVEVENETLKIPKIKNLPNPVKAMKMKLYIRKEKDDGLLNKIFGTVRWTYNKCVEFLKNRDDVKPTKKLLRSLFVNNDADIVQHNTWLLETGYDIRDDAIKDFLTSLKGNITKVKQGLQEKFTMQFRSKKRQKSECIYIRSRWIKKENNTISIKLPLIKKPIIFWLGSEKWNGNIMMDCKLQRTWLGEYYLCIPYVFGVDNQDSPKKNMRVCSIDPGVRTFQTILDVSNEKVYEVAPNDINYIVRLCLGLDKLFSKRDKASTSKKRCSYKRASRRLIRRIQNLINEVHKQLAKFLSKNFDLILIPKFETSNMVKKASRKIGSKSARMMTNWAHYRFRERLLFKCRESTCKIAIVDEAWTSKTCSSCGIINSSLGSSKNFVCSECKLEIDRDINGAKNIFLKNYEALGLNLTLGPTPFSLATKNCTE